MTDVALVQVAGALRAVEVRSSSGYAWFGEPSMRLGRKTERALGPDGLRSCLLGALKAELYRSFYTQGAPVPTPAEFGAPRLAEKQALLLALSSANRGRGCWEDDWIVDRTRPHRYVATRDGLSVAAAPALCRLAVGSTADDAQALYQVLTPKELVGMSPGYYAVASDAQLTTAAASRGVLRFYWNLTPAGRVALVRHATKLLNGAAIPFSLKVLVDPARFTRCDSAVLYVTFADVVAALPIVDTLRRRLTVDLMPATPVFAARLSAGLAFAEDPPDSESFGQSRCRLLAEGIVLSREEGLRTIGQCSERVERCFGDAGIDLRMPHLNAGSTADLAPILKMLVRAPTRAAGRRDPVPTSTALIDAAAAIGRSLCDEAVWSRRRCTWLGVTMVGANTSETAMSRTYGEVGPDLYAGTSGIAWFLTSLYRITGDRRVLETARGAVECALSRTETMSADARFGLYAGWSGVAVAAAQLGLAADDESLVRRAAALLLRLRTCRPRRAWDLMSGLAGAIVAAIDLHVASGRPALLACAAAFGERLIALADHRGGALSWKSDDPRERRNLTGVSHGVAGCAAALIELHVASGESRFLDAAVGAFEYERRRFDPATGTWPDYRPFADRRWHDGPQAAAAVWCHGAGGIALSRLRAFELLGDETCRREALVGLAKTRIALEAMRLSPTADRGLCHGVAGNADVLLHGLRVLGDDNGRMANMLHATAARLLEELQVGERGRSAVHDADGAPGAMLGRTGIGYLFLRLVDARSPSLLSMRHEDFKPSGAAITDAGRAARRS